MPEPITTAAPTTASRADTAAASIAGGGHVSPTLGGPPPPKAVRHAWRDLWQLPALIVGVVLFTAGAFVAALNRPPYDIDAALAGVRHIIEEEGAFDRALGVLNTEITLHLSAPHATNVHRGEFHALTADALYGGLTAQNLRHDENAERVLRQYERAQELLGTLSHIQSSRVVEALVMLGRIDEARARLDTIPTSESGLRLRLLRTIVSATIDLLRESRSTGVASSVIATQLPFTLALLQEYASEPLLNAEERRWAIARQAELRIESGYPAECVEHLLRAIQRYEGARIRDAAELLVLLGRAYYDLGQFADAKRRLEQADEALYESHPLRARVQAMLGRIAQMYGENEEARERYQIVVTDFPSSEAAWDAWLGLGETESMLGAFDRSVEAYLRLVTEPGPIHAVNDSLRDRAQERLSARDFENALLYAEVGLRIRLNDETPGWAHLAAGSAQRSLANSLLSPATLSDGSVDWALIDPVTREEVRRRLIDAAKHFFSYSRVVIGEPGDAYAGAMWDAGDTWDRAGEFPAAINAFTEFAQQLPNDPRRARARFRLAQAHQAMGDYMIASQLYRELIREDPPSGEGYMSFVPLVRSILSIDPVANASEAEQLLLRVVDGGVMAPDARDFRVALNVLGRLYVRAGRHTDAVARFQESVERYPDAPDVVNIRYALADALRMSAMEIEKDLREGMPQSRRNELEALRRERLERALTLYDAVCIASGERDSARMSSLDRIELRNAYFYRADCAFDLGDDEAAIGHYDVAANRYADDPASLVAMIQIVNAYTRLGRWEEARTANERARQRFRELPEHAFQRDDLPLERRHWERWLDSSTELSQRFERHDD